MKTWLISWNELKWVWKNYDEICENTSNGEKIVEPWTFANTHVKQGDRVFLMKLGQNPKGIIASGYAKSEIYKNDSFDPVKKAQREKTNHIEVEFDRILNYKNDTILGQSELKEDFPNQEWSPQSSGIEIKDEYASKLEELWKERTNMQNLIFDKLKFKEELDPNKHNGCYELVNKIIEEYSKLDDLSQVNYKDLDLIYSMTVGTWRYGKDKKSQSIQNSNLSQTSKDNLLSLLDNIWKKTQNSEYDATFGEGKSIGLFGTGFFTFKTKTKPEFVQKFIKMCIDVYHENDDYKIFEIVDKIFREDCPGLQAASASMMLHCLKPFTFPILNRSSGIDILLDKLGIKLIKREQIKNYIKNCKILKNYRDEKFKFKNYRIFDIVAYELHLNESIIDFTSICEWLNNYSGLNYIKPEKSNEQKDEMRTMKSSGKNAIEEFKKYANLVKKSYPDFDKLYCSSWINQAQIVPEYIWNEFKRSEYNDLPYSVSLAICKEKNNFKLYVRCEIRDISVINKSIYKIFNNVIYNTLNTDSRLVYDYDDSKGINHKLDKDYKDVEEAYNNSLIKKLRASIIIDGDYVTEESDRIISETIDAFKVFVPLYDKIVNSYLNDSFDNGKEIQNMGIGKNIILYGPPGTGKTYNTVNYAVAIIEGKPLEKVQNEEYENVFQRYKEYKQKGFIEFTSFHQSYGYEEFIEGIKPVIDFADDQQKDVQYEISSGLFKSFCDKALQPVFKNQKQELGVNDSPTIWKVSLESTYENKTRTECLKNNHIRIGYDSYGETITNDMNFDCGGKYILNAFISNMRIGDIVMSCYNNTTIDAIGVVTGDYEWHNEYEKYKRLRKVNWLVKNIREDILDINNGVTFTLSTVYRLKISLKDVMDIIKKYSNFKNFVEEKKKNYVFIIDEINRGNISKIFGELITLIEETKRIGKSEELKVRLPYSKEVFGVPNNVYILGTMNTSDRSIAAIDTALRRRFSFKEMLPNANLLKGVKVGDVDIKQMLEVMNKKITALYDREHTIGHSYLLPLKKDNSLDNLANIFENKIIPLLQEYFFEDYEKIQLVLGDNYKDDTNKFIVKHTDNFNALFGSGDSDNYADDFITYEINKEAFHNIESYKAICRTGEKNEKAISNN